MDTSFKIKIPNQTLESYHMRHFPFNSEYVTNKENESERSITFHLVLLFVVMIIIYM